MGLDFQTLEAFGYPGLLIGALLEGESVAILGAIAARQGYLDLTLVVAAVATGGFIGDQIYFEIGRRKGAQFLTSRAALYKRAKPLLRLFETHPDVSAFLVRFFYGFRTILPLMMGASSMSRARFLVLHFAGSVVWACCWVALGFMLGSLIEEFIGTLKPHEPLIFVGLILLAVLLWGAAHAQRKQKPPTQST